MAETCNQYIGVDLGAESGRVMLGTLAQDKLTLEEMHRFGNGPTEVDGAWHWDFATLIDEIKTGIGKAIKAAQGELLGISVDSWGVDYGLLDEQGNLLEQPYHYRDSRTEGMVEKAFGLLPKEDFYQNTGIQFMALNTVFQLLAHKEQHPEALAQAKQLIFMADLVAYHLCGKPFAEYTLASTSQLMDMASGQWSDVVFDKLGLPQQIMPPVVAPGTVIGPLTPAVCQELGCEPINVIATGSHDTASAVAAVPATPGNWAFLSCGTWSLIGAEIPQAVIDEKSFGYQFTNEGGVCDTIRLLKNIMGLWLVQECRRQWQREGQDLSYAEITAMAQAAQPFAAFVNPREGRFFAPESMPAEINAYLTETGQGAIEDKGQLIRVILESLALEYRRSMADLEDTSGITFDVLHMVGGGIQNELLCQFAANALDKTVIAGPVEGTASGNVLMQALATKKIESLEHARQIMRNSIEVKTYTPQDTVTWMEKYQSFVKQ